jgi:hypothetical protein
MLHLEPADFFKGDYAMDGDKDQKTTEVRETNKVQGDTNITRQTVATSENVNERVVLQRIIYYFAGVIIALLAIRIIFQLLGANPSAPFVDFIYTVSGIFAWPFYGIFSYEPSYGRSVFEMSSLVAIIVYALVAMGLARLTTLTSSNSGSDEV